MNTAANDHAHLGRAAATAAPNGKAGVEGRDHPLGSPAGWSTALRSLVDLVSSSSRPLALAWGPKLALFANNAGLSLLGVNALSLGVPVRDALGAAWPTLTNAIESTRATGQPTRIALPASPHHAAHACSLLLASDDAGNAGVLCAFDDDTPPPATTADTAPLAAAPSAAPASPTNEQLRRLERMASLSTLSSGLGHDIGNLLLPVRVRLDSLAQLVGDSAAAREDIAAIRTSAEHLQRLANGLRLLAAAPARAAPGEATSIAAWWEDAGAVLKNALPRGVTLETAFAPDLPPVAISRIALTQAIFNLLQNAGDAMRPRGSGRVRLAAELAGDHRTVRLSVEDDGPGMTPEVQAHCAEPFFTTKPRAISTGMGLVLVYGLLRDAGGSVSFTSRAGVGTTFVLTLALHQPTIAPTGKTAAVNIADARIRAFVVAELKALALSVLASEGAAPPDLLVTDNGTDAATRGPTTAMVLLNDTPPASLPAGAPVAVIGAKPRLTALRDALRQALSSR